MRYLFLAYGRQTWLEALSAGQRSAFEAVCQANTVMLRQSGYLLAMEAIHSRRSAITVRVRNGAVSVADGQGPEADEQLLELFFIDARDLNEAIQVASKMPQAGRGPIEVRPILEVERS